MFYKYILTILFCLTSLYSLDFKVASYNVENLFDLKYDGTEYNEYKPYSKYWNQKSFSVKLNNISKVINELNSDILALQEIESQNALNQLNKKLNYKYSQFIKNKNSSIGVAILSKFKIKEFERIIVDKYDKYSRDILKVTINIENKPLVIYVNHWRSKRAKESFRIKYATALKNDYLKLKDGIDYIVLGDLNSNYNEYQTFKYDKKLNNTYGITGINQVLNTTIDSNFVNKNNISKFDKEVHYNLWLDLKIDERFSSKFKTQSHTPDNILIPKSLFDNNSISYIDNSFGVFKPNYLYKNNHIKRWNRYKKDGYSDHLPIYAKFSTSKQTYKIINKNHFHTLNKIDSLYNIEQITEPLDIKNIIVVYKSKDIAIIKHSKYSKAIMIYKPPKSLRLGFRYDIRVNKLDYYNGLKEIKELSILNEIKYDKNYQNYLLGIDDIDIFDKQNQNQVLKDIEGIYINKYLYFYKNKIEQKVRLYLKKGINLPSNGSLIFIKNTQITIYKSRIQLTINNKKDFKIKKAK